MSDLLERAGREHDFANALFQERSLLYHVLAFSRPTIDGFRIRSRKPSIAGRLKKTRLAPGFI